MKNEEQKKRIEKTILYQSIGKNKKKRKRKKKGE